MAKKKRERLHNSLTHFLDEMILSIEPTDIRNLDLYYEKHVETEIEHLVFQLGIQERISLGIKIIEIISERKEYLKSKKNIINKEKRLSLLEELKVSINKHFLKGTRQVRESPMLLWTGSAAELANIFWQLKRTSSKDTNKSLLLNSNQEIAEFLLKHFSVFQEWDISTLSTLLNRSESPLKGEKDEF